GRRPVLLLGVPHPNEPIGTLTIDFLTRLLCEDDELRYRLDVTVFAVPVADPDGLVLNEGWFKGAFSPLRYALEFYRPPHREQVEWSFPGDYKTLRAPHAFARDRGGHGGHGAGAAAGVLLAPQRGLLRRLLLRLGRPPRPLPEARRPGRRTGPPASSRRARGAVPEDARAGSLRA